MIPILDWIFEGIVGWIASIVSQLFDAVSGLFLEALGTDMTAMEEYFPFVTKAYDIMQVTAWAILILIVVWQLFRAFGGPITEAENPWHLLIRGAIFAFLIGYAKPIFTACLSIARAPYTSLMDVTMTGEDFTFAGIEQALTSGLTTLVSVASVVGLILILILEIALGWNYFKLLLETVERYIVVGVLCYTSPLAFSVGGSKATNTVFRSWCRMVGSQLLLLVMNVWFLRGFASSMGQFIANGGALSTGKGSIFLWMFCALAYLKCAQRFDSYLASIGLNVAQTGSSMGMELLMAARVLTGAGSGARSAGSVFSRGGSAATGTGAAASGFAAGFASKFSPNSYVRDAVVDGGTRMGFGGGAGFVARAFGGIAARNGATLNGDSISSVASRSPNASGMIAGDIADRSLSNYMPHMKGFQMQGTQITGGHISTTATTPDGKKASVDMFNASQYEKPDAPHSVVTASDGSQWYQMASGEGRGAFYDAPVFGGMDAQQANAGNGHTETPAANDGESVGAQMHGNEQAEPANIVTGVDGMPQAVGAFHGDQAPTELSSDSLTENPGIIPGASDMPSLDDQQPAAVEGAFNEAGGPVSIGPDGMPMDGSAIRSEQTPAEFGSESLTENAGVMPGVSEMPGMVAEQSVGMEGGIHESGAPVTIGSESEGMPQAVGSFPGDQMPAEGLENLSESSGVIPDVSEMPGMEGGLNEVPASFGGEEMAPNTITGSPADQMPAFTPEFQEGMEGTHAGVSIGGDMSVVPESPGQSPDEMPAFGAFVAAPGSVPAAAGLVADSDEVPHPVGAGNMETGMPGGTEVPQYGDSFTPVETGQNIITFPGAAEMPGDSVGVQGSSEGGAEAPQFGAAFVNGADYGSYHDENLSGGMENGPLSGIQDGGIHDTNTPISTDAAGALHREEPASGYESETGTPQFGAGFVGGAQTPYSGETNIPGGDGNQHHHDSYTSGGDHGDGGGYHGSYAEAPLVAATFPSAQEGTMLRTVGDGVIEASSPDGGNTLWYNSAYYQEPDAPHSVMEAANGVQWYAMQQQAHAPQFESGENAVQYNQAAFQNFMPGYEGQVAHVDGTHRLDGHFEVRNADGSGTAFFDTARYAAPRGDYQVFEDARGSQWYAIRGEAAVERKPVFENGRPVYDGDNLRTVNVDTVRYKAVPTRYAEPEKRKDIERKPPRRKN